MKSFWNESDRNAMLARIDSVTAASKPLWGKMSAEAMLAHLEQTLRMTTGELPTKSKKLPIRYFPLKQLIIYLLPFPKGTPTAPELLVSNPAAVEETRRQLRQRMNALANFQGPFPEHPAFGQLTRNQTGVLIQRHFDHHLRQFGA